MFKYTLNFRFRPTDGSCELGGAQTFDVTQQQGASPFCRHPGQGRFHALLNIGILNALFC
jgi:hypothetical protein